MKEASELVDKMKNTPGMKNMESMLNKMGLGGGLGGKGKSQYEFISIYDETKY